MDHETLPGRSDAAQSLVAQLLAGRISRREFMRRAAIAGMSATAVGAALSTAARAQSPSAAVGGTFDPMRYAGSTVKIALVDGENDEKGILDKKPEILETMGITVEVETAALGARIEQNNQYLQADESPVDILGVLGFTVAGTVGADLFTELTPWVADASRTPADYAFDDFPDGQLEYVGYFDIASGNFGGDKLYLLPGIHAGSVIMYYRSDLLETAGLSVPATWDEYLAAAEAMHQGDVAGNSMIGANDVSLFLVDWYTRFITMGGQFTTGSKDDKTLNVNLNGAESVAALQHMVDSAKFASPTVSAYDFTQSVDNFMLGKTAMMVLWSTIGGPVFGPDSPIKDQVGVAQVPANAGQAARAIRGGWGLGIPKNLSDERKGAAYQVLTYITSAPFEKYQVGTYQTDPNRTSTGSDPELVAQLPYLPDAVTAIANAQILEIANIPQTFQIVGEIAREFNLAIAGTQDATTSCANAQTASETILRDGGWLT